MKRSVLCLATAGLLGIAAGAFAQTDVDRTRLDRIARTAAQQFDAARANDDREQTRPTVPPPPPATEVNLGLDEATARALERNLDIAVERLNPQTYDLQIARLAAAYKPSVSTTFRTSSTVTPPTSTLNGGFVVDTDTKNYNTGLTQVMPQFGGNFAFSFTNQKQLSNNQNLNYNPSYSTGFSATFVQPILRGFLIDDNRRQLRVTALNREASEIQVRGTVATTLASVRNAYWELVYAIDALDVARGSLTLAESLVEDNRARVEVGTLAPLDVVQSESEAASRRQAVAQAEATWRTSELALKRLVVNGTDDPLWGASIKPTDRPSFAPEPLNVEGAVRKALVDRTDLEQARRTIEANDVTLRYMSNQRLPALDLTTAYGASGIGGTQYKRASSAVGAAVTDIIPGGYNDAWKTLTARDYPNWNVQLNLTYPLGGSPADAQYARARVQRNQSAAQLRALELEVATDVTNAALQVQSSLRRYEAATSAHQLAQQRLDAEQSRFDVGLSTNFFVVQAQRDLATAQNTELRTLLDYRKALVDFQRAQEAPTTRGTTITTITTQNNN